MTVIDGRTGQPEVTVPVGDTPFAAAVDEGAERVMVVNVASRTVTIGTLAALH